VELEALLGVLQQRLKCAPQAEAASDDLAPWRPPEELVVADAAARLALFVSRAREGGATVETLSGRTELQPAVLRLLESRGWRSMVCADGLRTAAFESLVGAVPATADFGLCEAIAAVAEIGSVLLAHDAQTPRSVALLPPAVGFVVPASTIVSRITGALEMLDARGTALPSCLTFVRGPSRSADIGSVTCFGAHGPGQVWLWVLEDE
jgi:hypothetical protein